MKINDLFEEPYDLNSDFRPVVHTIATPSVEGLKRENEFLGELKLSEDNFFFWLNNSHKAAIVTILSITAAPRHEIILTVRFDNRSHLPVKNELQVHTVYNQPEYRNRNLAMAMYVLLVRYGFTVVSDFEQYNGGKALWKKMASESNLRRFTIRLWSDADEDWVTDTNGVPVTYTGTNVADSDIWTVDKNAPTTLLVLSNGA